MFEMENRWFARIRAASVIFLLMGLVYVGITLLHGFPVAAEQIPLLLESIIFLLLSATFFLAWRSVSQTRRGERAGFCTADTDYISCRSSSVTYRLCHDYFPVGG